MRSMVRRTRNNRLLGPGHIGIIDIICSVINITVILIQNIAIVHATGVCIVNRQALLEDNDCTICCGERPCATAVQSDHIL